MRGQGKATRLKDASGKKGKEKEEVHKEGGYIRDGVL
jgi:hypothetical protein